jgi:hypothetical protein
MKIYFSKNQKSVTVVLYGIELHLVPRWPNFRKTFLVFYKWPDLTDVQVVLRGTVTKFMAGMASFRILGKFLAQNLVYSFTKFSIYTGHLVPNGQVWPY